MTDTNDSNPSSSSSSSPPPPPLSFAVRHKSGVRVYGDPAQATSGGALEAELQLEGTAFVEMAFSKDGAVFGVVDGERGVRLFDATSRPYTALRTLERVGVQGSSLTFHTAGWTVA